MIQPLHFSMFTPDDLFGDYQDQLAPLQSFSPMVQMDDSPSRFNLKKLRPGMSTLSTAGNGGYGVTAPTQSFTPAWQPMGFTSTPSMRSLPPRTSFGGYNTPTMGFGF